MSTQSPHPPRPLQAAGELVDYFRAAGKPPERWRLGTEQEIIGVSVQDENLGAAPQYEGGRGIRAVLDSFTGAGWSPLTEGDIVIGHTKDHAAISIEPGGQLEIATEPVSDSSGTHRDLRGFMDQLLSVGRELDLAWLDAGFRPFGTLDDVSWMPKGRYVVMREYLPTRGALAHEMMKRTATVQANLDFQDADDAARKLRCIMSVTSILTAIYANSPIVDGHISGMQSYRATIWRDTDPDRCGLLEFAFSGGDIFEMYTQWALDVPMFFVSRAGYIPADGTTFRQFMHEGFQGHTATLDDWSLHLSTLFPEARLKQFLEVRGCDSGPLDMALALAPLCRGILYDRTSLDAATALTRQMSFSERVALGDAVGRTGLATRVGAHTLGDLAADLLNIARDGLSREAPEEIDLLDPLYEIVNSGVTRADTMVAHWTRTSGDPAQVIAALRHR